MMMRTRRNCDGRTASGGAPGRGVCGLGARAIRPPWIGCGPPVARAALRCDLPVSARRIPP